MAWLGVQYSLGTSPVTLTTALGLTTSISFNSATFVVASGAETVFGGTNTLTNTPKDAGFKVTATLPYTLPVSSGFQGYNSDQIFIVATATADVLISVLH